MKTELNHNEEYLGKFSPFLADYGEISSFT